MPLDLGLVIGDTGPTGPTGPTGTSLTIRGTYDSLQDLEEAHPTGETGDAYIINGNIYLWDNTFWNDLGPFRGQIGYSPTMSIDENGHLIASFPDDAVFN